MQSRHLAFIETLFRQYHTVLCAYACRFVGNAEAAEDIVQDVFLAVWDNRNSLITNGGGIKSYLFRSVYNRSLNYLSRKSYLEEDSLDKLVDHIGIDRDEGYNQENIFAAEEIRRVIASFTETLMPQARRVFEYSRMQGLKVAEIADMMGLSHKTVEKHLYKALGELRNKLKESGYLLAAWLVCQEMKNLV